MEAVHLDALKLNNPSVQHSPYHGRPSTSRITSPSYAYDAGKSHRRIDVLHVHPCAHELNTLIKQLLGTAATPRYLQRRACHDMHNTLRCRRSGRFEFQSAILVYNSFARSNWSTACACNGKKSKHVDLKQLMQNQRSGHVIKRHPSLRNIEPYANN